MNVKKHVCERATYCICYIGGTEPAEDCPVHGSGEWPPRCAICGKFMKWPDPSYLYQIPSDDDQEIAAQ